MASTSETGHAINIANFKILIERCQGFGAAYNPANSDLSIANMEAKLTSVETLHEGYLTALAETKLPINDREILYEELDRLVVRTYNIYFATNASKASLKDAKGYLNKITGRNVKIPKMDDGITPDPNYVSNSQQSYVQKADNFDKLVNLYKADTNYDPNEVDLQVAALETMLENLKTANENVYNAVANAINKRTARDHGLYDLKKGIYDLSVACKRYVKGLYGGTSPEAASVIAIKLRRRMKINPV